MELVVGSRGSTLALAQTQIVLDLLRKENKNLSFKLKIIKTSGDESATRTMPKLTGKDSFTRELDLALQRGKIDFAVHSLKDVPVENIASRSKREVLIVGAYPRRESPYDALISKRSQLTLQSLPQNARIGTSSLRRAIQLKIYRPDFQIVEIHGNVPTRIRKMREKEVDLDAIVLAEAGLKRLGLEREIDQVFPVGTVLPAIGQGCLAVKVRSSDISIKRMMRSIDDSKTRACAIAERSFSKELGGGCNTPIAGLARISGNRLRLKGMLVGETKAGVVSSKFVIRNEIEGDYRFAEALGKKLATKMKAIMR